MNKHKTARIVANVMSGGTRKSRVEGIDMVIELFDALGIPDNTISFVLTATLGMGIGVRCEVYTKAGLSYAEHKNHKIKNLTTAFEDYYLCKIQ